MRLPVPSLALALYLLAVASGFHVAGMQDGQQAGASQPPKSLEQTAPAQQPPAPAGVPSTTIHMAPRTTEAGRKTAKGHKVYTNEDLEGRGAVYSSHPDYDQVLEQVNDCDRNCFEVVRQMANVPPGAGIQWKRDLLDAVDRVKADADWQGYLREMIDVKYQLCTLQAEKTADLRRFTNPRNVTSAELALDAEYARKFKAAGQALDAVYDKAAQHIFDTQPNSLQAQLMHLQLNRIMSATCQYGQSADPDPDPDDPDES